MTIVIRRTKNIIIIVIKTLCIFWNVLIMILQARQVILLYQRPQPFHHPFQPLRQHHSMCCQQHWQRRSQQQVQVLMFFQCGDAVNKISTWSVAVFSNPTVCDVCVFHAAVTRSSVVGRHVEKRGQKHCVYFVENCWGINSIILSVDERIMALKVRVSLTFLAVMRCSLIFCCCCGVAVLRCCGVEVFRTPRCPPQYIRYV